MRLPTTFLQSEFDTIKASSVRRVKRLTGRRYYATLNEVTFERYIASINERNYGNSYMNGDDTQ
jgi:hypothetical protein